MHDIGFHSETFDIKTVDENIDKHKENYVKVVYKSPTIVEKPIIEDDDIEKETEIMKETINEEGGSKSQQSSSF